LRDGSIDFYVGPEPGRSAPSDLKQETLFYNTRTVLGRRNHPLAGATSLAELADAEWATTSITLQAEEEMGELFRLHGLGAPRLALQSQSALTLIVTLAHTDLLAMVPVQWMDFAPMAGILQTTPGYRSPQRRLIWSTCCVGPHPRHSDYRQTIIVEQIILGLVGGLSGHPATCDGGGPRSPGVPRPWRPLYPVWQRLAVPRSEVRHRPTRQRGSRGRADRARAADSSEGPRVAGKQQSACK
jgi:LysR substrate binding domain